ncbi:MAG: cobalamin-independent methionine synthase II family protein [Proteobacteria bacterium]|nr:cobalamin-independent methionine synthase II family protein [Pseudomonadota bacterium]MYJ94797.1 cobalamin-independent methionine synthase II family protein [Pseudomonadota bacterium]
MLRATADIMLPTTIIGSLPRPSWFTENLGSETFLRRLMNSRYREQYIDAVAVHLRDQEVAGLDICTDGDAHYDEEVGGQSWTSYPLFHMDGLERTDPQPTVMKTGGVAFPMGHILHDYLEARIMPRVVGPIGRGDLQYTAMWKTAQRLTAKPVKFGTVTPDILSAAVDDQYYSDPIDRMMAFSDALNEELHDLADAGCPIVQMEEPALHMIPVRGKVFGRYDMADMAGVFDNTVRGLREKTEVWCHTCWGNPSQQRMFKEVQSYESALETYNGIDADVITFESTSSGMRDIPAIGRVIEEKKIAIGMIDHHSLQIERPEEIAQRIRDTLKHIPAERLILCSDCGMGREGMSRRHARYKMAALVQGTNIVRRELGLPEAECLAADGRYSLVPVE